MMFPPKEILPTIAEALPRLGADFVAVCRRADELTNQIEELQVKIEEYVKTSNPALFKEIEDANAERDKINETLRQARGQIDARDVGEDDADKK